MPVGPTLHVVARVLPPHIFYFVVRMVWLISVVVEMTLLQIHFKARELFFQSLWYFGGRRVRWKFGVRHFEAVDISILLANVCYRLFVAELSCCRYGRLICNVVLEYRCRLLVRFHIFQEFRCSLQTEQPIVLLASSISSFSST